MSCEQPSVRKTLLLYALDTRPRLCLASGTKGTVRDAESIGCRVCAPLVTATLSTVGAVAYGILNRALECKIRLKLQQLHTLRSSQ